MPTLQFKGKNIIWNHHLSVPYHTLEEVEDLHFQPEKGNGNLIIEGDNLIALKALLPEYAGKVKCIYIDPPYNTGNEGWVYNDNVNSPLINEWLGKVVGTDDLTRHDKWLCMMTPRLFLLRDLLANDGVIFISIDDNALTYLRVLCDEIFGQHNFVAVLPRITKKAGKTTGSIAKNNDYILVYKKDENLELADIEVDEDNYELEDEYFLSRGHYKLSQTLDYGSIQYSPSLDYEIELDGFVFIPGGVTKDEMEKRQIRNPKSDWCWRWSPKLFKFGLENGFVEVKETKNGKRIYTKTYLNATIKKNNGGYIIEEVKREKKPTTLEFIDNKYSNDNSKKEIEKIFGYKAFDYSKPSILVLELLKLSNNKDSIILDSFAGSGTTMQAVNELNKVDGGSRKCILVQMKEENELEPDKNNCQNITRERNKLAIEKLGYESGFKYLKVGTAIDPEKMLEGQLPTYEQFAKYIYYLGTGEHLADAKNINAENHFVGTHGAKAFYLIYKQDVETLTRLALNLSIAEDIVKHSPNKRRVIYAPACFLDSDYMEEKQIEFVSIPYNLFERQTN
ncbi:MAG: putative methyltransferase [Bacteroidetes bacterium ADurb.Bin141]|nr:MAG: putative methyltransferase [Bacteroidetes bacterium ADurb.Bin141]